MMISVTSSFFIFRILVWSGLVVRRFGWVHYRVGYLIACFSNSTASCFLSYFDCLQSQLC